MLCIITKYRSRDKIEKNVARMGGATWCLEGFGVEI